MDSETLPGVEDGVLLQGAQQQERLLLTADLDCGELGFRERFTSHGVVLLRLEDLTLQERLARFHVVWSGLEQALQHTLAHAQAGRHIVVHCLAGLGRHGTLSGRSGHTCSGAVWG